MASSASGARTAFFSATLPMLADEWQALARLSIASPVDIAALCATVARVMEVKPDEVGFLKIRGLSLEFIYPFALKSAGRIPLSSFAVAARTAISGKSEVFNNFTKVPHNSVFELVPLGDVANSEHPQHIQRLISVPVLDANRKATGVIQISRKGKTPAEAGAEFNETDSDKLRRVAHTLSSFFETL